ncbi:fibrobacter succinogenes major paralogous domain-containing protein [Pelodictyon luteolum]|nr:fibrobacter succinogenes major paralogous domain-containing protein [Pelodictyon luteolum]
MRVFLAALFFVAGCVEKRGGELQGVPLGGMEWSASNLDIERYRNGDPVPEARTEAEWHEAASRGDGAWCRYEGEEGGAVGCGRLYNWHTVHDPRGLAPAGWHVATEDEWDRLALVPGGLRSLGILSTGIRNCLGAFYGHGVSACFWTADSSGAFEAWDREVASRDPERLVRVSVARSLGLSVRCVRDRPAQ